VEQISVPQCWCALFSIRANLTGCQIYGISAWDVQLERAIQLDLIITPTTVPAITVDNLEVAQFIYLLFNNKKIRDVIETVGKKVVLILGSFTPDRKAIYSGPRISDQAIS